MVTTRLARRAVLISAAGLLASPRVNAQTGPIALSIVDVAGNLQLTKAGLERFRTTNPDLVSGITYTQAPSPELPSKLKAQQAAGRMDIDLVLTGPGALSDGITQGLWEEMLPKHAAALPKLDEIFIPGAKMMQDNFGRGQGIAVAYSPSGPLFEYIPARVKDVPKTAADLLAWVRAHPNRFTYAPSL